MCGRAHYLIYEFLMTRARVTQYVYLVLSAPDPATSPINMYVDYARSGQKAIMGHTIHQDRMVTCEVESRVFILSSRIVQSMLSNAGSAGGHSLAGSMIMIQSC
jgi:hypothetical protein